MTASLAQALIAAEDGLIAHIRQHAELISRATYRVPDDRPEVQVKAARFISEMVWRRRSSSVRPHLVLE